MLNIRYYSILYTIFAEALAMVSAKVGDWKTRKGCAGELRQHRGEANNNNNNNKKKKKNNNNNNNNTNDDNNTNNNDNNTNNKNNND